MIQSIHSRTSFSVSTGYRINYLDPTTTTFKSLTIHWILHVGLFPFLCVLMQTHVINRKTGISKPSYTVFKMKH